MAVPLLKLGRTLDEATVAIRKAHEGSAPLLDDAQTTLRQVNTQLERVDGITAGARTVSTNVSVLTSLFTATLGGPLVRAAAAVGGGGSEAPVLARRRARRGRVPDQACRRGRTEPHARRDRREPRRRPARAGCGPGCVRRRGPGRDGDPRA